MKTLIIMMFFAVLFGFAYQVFVVYALANNVSTSVQRSIMTTASLNMPTLFGSLKEGSASAQDIAALVTVASMEQNLSEELGVEILPGEMVKRNSSGGWDYRIHGMDIRAENIAVGSGTVRYTAEFVLEIPVAAFWDFGSFSIPMHVEAKYTQKF